MTLAARLPWRVKSPRNGKNRYLSATRGLAGLPKRTGHGSNGGAAENGRTVRQSRFDPGSHWIAGCQWKLPEPVRIGNALRDSAHRHSVPPASIGTSTSQWTWTYLSHDLVNRLRSQSGHMAACVVSRYQLGRAMNRAVAANAASYSARSNIITCGRSDSGSLESGSSPSSSTSPAQWGCLQTTVSAAISTMTARLPQPRSPHAPQTAISSSSPASLSCGRRTPRDTQPTTRAPLRAGTGAQMERHPIAFVGLTMSMTACPSMTRSTA